MIKEFLILFILHFTFCEQIEKENEVIVINDENFDGIVETQKPILINFYAPWCQYSKKIKPHFERVAEDFALQNVPIRLGKVDVTVEKDLAKRFEIKRYPTLIFFKEDRQIFYNKTHNYMVISNWIISKTEKLVVKVTTAQEYDDIIKYNDVVLLIEESRHSKDFDISAEYIDDIQFAVLSKSLLSTVFPEYQEASLVIRRKFDMVQLPFYGTVSQESIKQVCLSNELAPVVTYSRENGAKIFSNPYQTQHFLVFANQKLEDIETELNKATRSHNEIRFAIIDTNQNITENLVRFFKVNLTDLPYMILSDTTTKKTFRPDFVDVNGEKIDAFIKNVKDGKVEQFLRTKPIPDNWDSEPLKVLVGKNFEQVAYDKSKHVFVEFYAPWCSHCKELAPIWERLAKSLAHIPDLVIAKLDKTENDVRDIEINSFPTLKLFLKESNEMVSYTGLRTKKTLLEFLEKYTNIKIDKEEL